MINLTFVVEDTGGLAAPRKAGGEGKGSRGLLLCLQLLPAKGPLSGPALLLEFPPREK